jgi:hypothetical protein
MAAAGGAGGAGAGAAGAAPAPAFVRLHKPVKPPIVDAFLELSMNQGWTATEISKLAGMPSRKTIGE